MSAAKAALLSLHDIRGVQGSFVSLPGGELVARESLPVVSDAGLGDTGRRLSTVFETVYGLCPGSDEVVLRFEGLALFARRNMRAMVAVVVSEGASLPALRMASNLVLRQLEKMELAPISTADPLPASPDVPPPAPAAAPARFWRGTRIVDE